MCLSIYYTCLWSVYFGRVSPWGFFLAGRVIFSVCVGLRCVECRSGTIYLSASLGWVAGLYRFFFFLGSVVVSIVRFILVLAGGERRGCTGFFLVLFVGLAFSKLLILF